MVLRLIYCALLWMLFSSWRGLERRAIKFAVLAERCHKINSIKIKRRVCRGILCELRKQLPGSGLDFHHHHHLRLHVLKLKLPKGCDSLFLHFYGSCKADKATPNSNENYWERGQRSVESVTPCNKKRRRARKKHARFMRHK